MKKVHVITLPDTRHASSRVTVGSFDPRSPGSSGSKGQQAAEASLPPY